MYARLSATASQAAAEASASAKVVNDLDAQRVAIANDITQLQSLIATEQERLNQAAADAASLQATANSAGWDANAFAADVSRLTDCAFVVARERDAAARRLRYAIDHRDDR